MSPIYAYECVNCRYSVDKVQSMMGQIPKCEKCGGDMVKKLSTPAVIKVKSGGILKRSKGYKEGYSKEYLRDVSPETQ